MLPNTEMKKLLGVFLLSILLSANCLEVLENGDHSWISKEFAPRGARRGENEESDSPRRNLKTARGNLEELNCPPYGSCESAAATATTTTTMKTPMLQVSFNLRELIERCTSGECRVSDEMRIREPFYVEEPGWIQISRHYPNEFARRFSKNDPFFGTRGKKEDKEFRRKDNPLRSYGGENPKDVFRQLMKENVALPEGN